MGLSRNGEDCLSLIVETSTHGKTGMIQRRVGISREVLKYLLKYR